MAGIRYWHEFSRGVSEQAPWEHFESLMQRNADRDHESGRHHWLKEALPV